MAKDPFELAWNMMVELRKELIELQKLRTQVVGFKITFVSASIVAIAANFDKIPIQLLSVPAFAAIFFDFVIANASISIKRIGQYCLTNLEPVLTENTKNWPPSKKLWHSYLEGKKSIQRQLLAQVGNLGITTIAVIAGTFALRSTPDWKYSLPLFYILLIFFAYDLFQMYRSGKPLSMPLEKDKENSQEQES